MGTGILAKASALIGFAALSVSFATPTLAADTATAPSATVASSGSQNPFADVPANSWAYQAIDQLHADGLIEGYPDGYFKGNRPLTRYEIAVLTQRVADKLEADLADASKAAKVNSDDIVLVRRLLDTYGADLAEVKQNLARTQHQTEENTKQLERAQIHVGYILRPGEYSQRSVIVNNATGLEVANGSTAFAGPVVNPGGANPYTDGHTTHGTGYQILRLGLTGQIDPKTSYNVRISNAYLFDSTAGTTGSTANALVAPSYQGTVSPNPSSNSTLNLDYANIQYAWNKNLTLTGGRYIAKNSPIGLLYSDYFNGLEADYTHHNWDGQLGYSFNTAATSNGIVNGAVPGIKPGESIFAHAGYKFTKNIKGGVTYLTDLNSTYGAFTYQGPAATGVNDFQKPQNNGSINAEYKVNQKINLQGELARHFGKDPATGNSYIQPYSFWGKAFYGDTSPVLNHNYAEGGLIIAGVNGLSAHSSTFGQGDDYQQFYLNNLDGYHVAYAGVHHYFSNNARIGLVYQRDALNRGVTLPTAATGFSVTRDQGQALFLETVLQF